MCDELVWDGYDRVGSVAVSLEWHWGCIVGHRQALDKSAIDIL